MQNMSRIFNCLLVATILLRFFITLCLSKSGAATKKRCALPPGPTRWPLVGSLLRMIITKQPYSRWVLGVSEGNDITCIKLGTTHTIVVNSPDLAREFLKKQDASFASRPPTMGSELAGGGYLTIIFSPWGEQWKKMRRIVHSTALSPARLRRQEALRREEANHLVNYIYKIISTDGEQCVDVRLAVRYYCGNVIRRMMFGKRWLGEECKINGLPGKEEVEHVEAAFSVLSLVYSFRPSDYVPALRVLDLDGQEKTMRAALDVINRYHDPIIDERVALYHDHKKIASTLGEDEEEKQDMLDAFISLKDADGNPLLTTEEIKAQLAELMYAAIDNPSNIVEWALAHMLDQPEIMRKAVEELDRVVGRDRLVEESDFAQLVYIKACAREALRLHPVSAFNPPHVALHDTHVAGYFIPKGSSVVLSRVGLGCNPNVWDDPMRFDPERHTASVELAEPDLRFVSFAAGRRACVGAALGSTMTFMMLARLLQAFEWRLPSGDHATLDMAGNSFFMPRPLCATANPRLPLLPELLQHVDL